MLKINIYKSRGESFIEYISKNTIVFTKDIQLASHRISTLFDKAEESFEKLNTTIKHASPKELFLMISPLKKQLQQLF